MTKAPTDRTTAAVILSSAIDFMANKAGVSAQEIVAIIDADRTGHAASYLRQLLALGTSAVLA